MEPFVSVVICTMGYPNRVIECLKKQTYQDFEIIVAQENGIVNAMNLALKRAEGEIFVRLDDDVEMPSTWLQELLKPFFNPIVAGATGPTFVPKNHRDSRNSIRIAENPGWFLRWMFDNRTFAPAAIYKCGSVSYDSNYAERFETDEFNTRSPFIADHLEGTNWAMRTELIRMVGGFDPSFDGVAEWFDTDVEAKIKKLGYKLMYSPNAYLFHLLAKGANYSERYDMMGRIENWIRYHRRHSKFHYKKVIWLLIMIGYGLCQKFR